MSDSVNLKEGPRVTSGFDADTTAAEVASGTNLTGRDVIVTGAGGGIGLETARVLASVGARVTIAVRNLDQGLAAAAAINLEIGAERAAVEALDLASLASVRDFARRWGERPLHILVNNAGVMACPLAYTTDGFETQFGVNHLGHFLLTRLLTPALERDAPGRVVALSSTAHLYGDVDFDDPNYRRRPYRPFQAYGQSKTANALFAVEFDRLHRSRGVRSFSVMPGVIHTNLGRHMTPEIYEELGMKPRAGEDAPARVIKQKSIPQGAATSVWAAIGRELDGFGGLYLEDCNQAEPYSAERPDSRGVASYALDPANAERLWSLSETLVDAVR